MTNLPDAALIAERHRVLLGRLRAVAAANGHDAERLRIIGITKGWPMDVARAAFAAGLTLLGENRVQEAEPKLLAVPGVEWHLVGQLQRNKARRAVRAFAAIHSIDSVELLDRVAALADEERRRPRVLLQVNVSGERTKGGMAPDEVGAAELVAAVRAHAVVGLMTIAPLGADEAAARAVFRRLRSLRDELQQASGMVLPELSMGMSADAEAAAAEGATLVRIGTALFGPRPDPLLSSSR